MLAHVLLAGIFTSARGKKSDRKGEARTMAASQELEDLQKVDLKDKRTTKNQR